MLKTKNGVIANRGLNNYACKKQWQNFRSEDYHEYRKKWHSCPEYHQILAFPLHLDLDITNSCNLTCKMCARTIMIDKGNMHDIGFMDLDFVKNLIDQGAENGLASIKFNFQGEPLLHPDIVEMIAYAKETGIIDTMFNTNGMLLTEEKAALLLDAGLDNIFFSVDSAYKEKHEAIRPGADYDRIINNIHTFLRLKDAKKKYNVQVGVNMVVMEENKDEVEMFVDHWSDIVDTVNWGLDHHFVLKEEQGNIGFSLQAPTDFCCSQLWQRLIVTWEGQCLPCCLDVERELVVGNAHTTSLQEIWMKSPLYKQLRKKHSSGNFEDMKRCRGCSFAILS